MFRLKFLLTLTTVVTGLEVIAAEREMPNFDIAVTCRGSGQVETAAKCRQDEQAARDQLAKLWPQYRQSDASRCVQIVTTGGASGYVELLTCLQDAKSVEKAPTDPFGPIPAIAK
jgi:hypothetical protein